MRSRPAPEGRTARSRAPPGCRRGGGRRGAGSHPRGSHRGARSSSPDGRTRARIGVLVACGSRVGFGGQSGVADSHVHHATAALNGCPDPGRRAAPSTPQRCRHGVPRRNADAGRPLFGEQRRYATAEEPVGLDTPSGGDAPQDHLRSPSRVGLGVGQSHVLPQEPPQTSHRSMPRCSRRRSMSAMRRGVVLLARSMSGRDACGVLRPHRADRKTRRDTRWGRRTAGARSCTRSPARLEHHDRLPERVAARLPVDAVVVSDVEHPVPVGIDPRVQVLHPEQSRVGRDVTSARRASDPRRPYPRGGSNALAADRPDSGRRPPHPRSRGSLP